MDFPAAAMPPVYTQQAAAPAVRAAVCQCSASAPPDESASEQSPHSQPHLRMPSPARRKSMNDAPDEVGVRQEIRTFFYPDFKDAKAQKEALQRRDLFILGFTHWLSLPKEDIDSYVQIAGVHGRPMSIGYGVDAPLMEDEVLAADEVSHTDALTKLKYNDRSGPGDGPVQFSNMGVSEFAYCKHGRPTFMTWHRPYVYMAERAIRKCAKYLVEQGMIRGNLQEAKKQADLIRLPYWNWCVEAPVPDVLLTDTIALTQFSMDGLGTSSMSSDLAESNDRGITGLPHHTVIPNPFKSFKPTAQQFEYFNGEVPVPEKFEEPQGASGTLTDYDSNCVFGPSGTLRTPGWSSYLSNYLVKSLRHNVGRACMYENFIAQDGDVAQSASHWFEAAHNALHNVFSMSIAPEHGRPKTQHEPTTSTGTNPGVVTIMGRSAMLNDCSTFDPAFFFHHCFVDCQLAMQEAAYPDGLFIPHIKNPENKDVQTSYYPDIDPVPAGADLKEHLGQNNQWKTSAFHPWTTGLFPELFRHTESLMEERRKLRQQAACLALAEKNHHPRKETYVPRYVDSGDARHCTRWGVTYQMLLTEKAQQEGCVKLPLLERERWMMNEREAQSKFIFDFTDDPFLRLVKKGREEHKLGEDFPWPNSEIPPQLLHELFEASTPYMWVLQMKLPKFFKVADGSWIGRSWTLNAYWWDEENSKLPAGRRRDPARLRNLTPKDVAFVGSASVFAPFNLRACLNCQHDNDSMLVSIDLTDMIVQRKANHLTTTQIRKQIDLQAVGVPASMLPAHHTWLETFKCEVIRSEQPTVKKLEKGSVSRVLMKWKKTLYDQKEAAMARKRSSRLNSAAAATSQHIMASSAAHSNDPEPKKSALTEEELDDIWRTFREDPYNQPRLHAIVSLLKDRSKPIHKFSFSIDSATASQKDDHSVAAAASHDAAAAAAPHSSSAEATGSSGAGEKRKQPHGSSNKKAVNAKKAKK